MAKEINTNRKEVCLLHGDLDLTVEDAERPQKTALELAVTALPILFVWLQPTKPGLMLACGSLCYVAARHLFLLNQPQVSISVSVAGAQVAQTRRKRKPTWKESFSIPLAHPVTEVKFQVKRKDPVFRDMGTATVSAEEIATGEQIDKQVLVKRKFFQFSCPKYIHLKMKFTPCYDNPKYSKGVARDQGLKESYFPLRRGGKVTLYQDAHVSDGMLPEIKLDSDKIFKHENCWEDICHEILGAKHLVYIVGWSIHHKVKLVREPNKELQLSGKHNLGDLLKYKSQQGVKVLLLIWRDKTGRMDTRDKETCKFFSNTGVTCVRAHHREFAFHDPKVDDIIYSHHQKCVIVDTQAQSCKRRIIAFLGGLDLAEGRYDTPKHQLFCGLDTDCKDDYYNPMFSSRKEGPRQPWHDLHCRIEGPAAYDVLKNFKQRWIGEKSLASEINSLIKIEIVPWMISPPLHVSKEADSAENWNVQVFRSIDSESVREFPKKAAAAKKQNLVCGVYLTENLVPGVSLLKNQVDEVISMIDRSIQMAYINAIRSAQHFIYIENQYFIGSSYAWSSYKNAGANNLIPMELALKITDKIKANEQFAVYVVIPMWPDGHPTAKPEILYKQAETMRMMYRIIADELKSSGLENAHPTDYLNFYCLGNREKPPEKMNADSQTSLNISDMTGSGGADHKESASKRYRRFMIYVHSKGMIVDDEYVILGSANINERSMAGSRDTEIAIGAYQPHHTWAKEMKHPHGQVYGYRMSLWAEHLGNLDDRFKEPENLDCVKEVNRIANENWTRYADEEFISPLEGHILKYPVQVEADGTVNSLPGLENFPDVDIKILGARTILPDRLTA